MIETGLCIFLPRTVFLLFVLAGVSTLDFNRPISRSNGSRAFSLSPASCCHISYPNRYWSAFQSNHLRVNVRYETPQILRMFQTFALTVRVSGEAQSHFGDCSKASAGKSFNHTTHLAFPRSLFPSRGRNGRRYWAHVWALPTWIHAYNKSLAPDTYTAFTHHSLL